MPRRRRVNLHQINEDVSDKFLTLKSNLELLDNLEELDKHFNSKQPIIRSQLNEIKAVILNQLFQIQASGTSLIDLYQKIGAKLLKGNLLRATQDIELAEEKQGKEAEYVTPPINTEKYLEDRSKHIISRDPVHLITEASELRGAPALQQQAALNYLYAKQNLKPVTRKTKDVFEQYEQLKLEDPARYYAFQSIRDKVKQHQYNVKRQQIQQRPKRPKSAERNPPIQIEKPDQKRKGSVQRPVADNPEVENKPDYDEEESKVDIPTQAETRQTTQQKFELSQFLSKQSRPSEIDIIIGRGNQPTIHNKKYVELKAFGTNKDRRQIILSVFEKRPSITGVEREDYASQEEFQDAIMLWYGDNFISFKEASKQLQQRSTELKPRSKPEPKPRGKK